MNRQLMIDCWTVYIWSCSDSKHPVQVKLDNVKYQVQFQHTDSTSLQIWRKNIHCVVTQRNRMGNKLWHKSNENESWKGSAISFLNMRVWPSRKRVKRPNGLRNLNKNNRLVTGSNMNWWWSSFLHDLFRIPAWSGWNHKSLSLSALRWLTASWQMSASSLAPYIPLTCEEISTVTSVAHWTNTRVRIIGEVSGRIPADETSILKSLGEDSAHEVILDLTLAPEKSGILLHPGSWVQVK